MSTSALSKANKEAILRAARAQGLLSRAEIAHHTGLSMATASRLVTTLVTEGLLSEAGSTNATGGRPSRMVKFNDTAAVTLSIDVAGSHTDVALVDLGAHVLHRARHPATDDANSRVAQTIDLARTALEDAITAGHRCVAAGISVPGPVDTDGTVDFAPALDWHRVPLGALLERHLSVPTVVENDANLIALAEFRHGRSRGVESLVAVAVFEGIGSGIIEAGRLWRGSHGASGQLGRMLLDTSALRNVYAGFGDLETRLGTRGIARQAAASGLTPTDGDLFTLLFTARERGDTTAVALLDDILEQFAMSLANVCALLDPQAIVFAGLFDEWAHVVIPELERLMVGHVLHLPELRSATPGLDATLIGAADAAFEHFGSITNLL